MFRVVWKSKDGHHNGACTPVTSEHAAQNAADMMNRKHPELIHWVEPVADEPEMPKGPTR